MAGEIGSLLQNTRGFLAGQLGRFDEIGQKQQEERRGHTQLGDYIGARFDPLARLTQINATWGGTWRPNPTADWLLGHGSAMSDPFGVNTPKPKETGGGAGPFNPQQGPGGQATYSGIPSEVAQWGNQTQATFGDLGAWVPDTMLAIMINESGGSPDAHNVAGDAWGLFQQVGLGNKGANAQFQAARQLAQEKLAGINAAYAKNGLNPDERTRALDLALAWAGHFDYGTGRMNPGSVDYLVGGQTSQQFANIFLANYDKVKGGKQQAAAGYQGTGGMASIWGGGNGPITQQYGAVTPGIDQGIYGYGAAYGLAQGHTGDDIGLARGTKLYMPAGLTGVVTTAGGTPYFRDEDYGDRGTPGKGELRITLSNGDILILGHTSQINVGVGQQLKGGDFVGLSGSANGDHLHLEVRRRNPDGSYSLIDPAVYFGGASGGGGGNR